MDRKSYLLRNGKRTKFRIKTPKALWDWLPKIISRELKQPDTAEIRSRCHVEIDYKPSEEELENIIAKWKHDSELYPSADVGFWINGNAQPFWLRQSLASDTFDLNVRFLHENVLVDPDDLLNELHRKQEIILKVLGS